MILSFVILFISFVLLISYLSKKGRPKNYPPGPYPFPIVGNLLQLSKEPYRDFIELRKKYGDIFAVDLGSLKAVILNDYKLIKEAFSHTNISGRPQFPHFMEPESGGSKGILFTEGKEWMEQRRFMLKTLRDFGFGKMSMESLVHEEIKELIESLKEDVNKPIHTNHRFNIAVFNALWTILVGERRSHSETKMQALINQLSQNMESSDVTGYLLFFPWLSKLMPEYSGFNNFIKNNTSVYNFMREVIADHKSTYQSGNNRDVLDCYLQHMDETTDTESSFHKNNGDFHLVMSLYDLFLAGTETTSTTLTWMFLIMARHPDIQEKLHDEIKNVVGDSRLPSLADKPNLPYLDAVVMELLRFSALVPLTFRRTVEDVELHGHFIPKGTAVLANLYCVHNDPKVWGDPENFRPERFLNEDGTKAVKNEALISFGYGRRFCLGESLARDQLFLFSASLIQRFKVILGPNESRKIETIPGTSMMYPKPQNIVLHDRYAQQ